MAGNNSNTPVVLQAAKALDKFKYEIASELGFKDWVNNPTGYYGYVSSRDNGAIGGHMVRRMIEAAERSLVEQTLGQLNAGFAAGFNQAAQTGPFAQQGGTLASQGGAFAAQTGAGPSIGSPSTTINSFK